MKTLFLTTVVLITFLLIALPSSAQSQHGNLAVRESGFGYRYSIDDNTVTSQEFMERLSLNPEAAKMFKSGKGLTTAGNVIGCIGAFGLGFDLGTRIGGGDGSNELLIAGGGVMAGGLVLYFIGRGKMKKSLNLYNNSQTRANLNLNLSGEGIGLCLSF